jgi:peptidoglycan-associated lipoprotein
VFFDFDEYVLSSGALNTSRSLAECLNAVGGAITLEGHCDERGTDEYNLALGQRRASTVKKAIGDLGVEANRIRTVSFGEERPACSGHDEPCWRQNRRVQAAVD